MSNSPNTVTSIRWSEICPWLILVRAARVSLMLRVIALALVGVVVTQLGWSLIDRLLLDAADRPALARLTDAPTPRPAAATVLDADAGVAVHAHLYGGALWRGWKWAMQPATALASADHPRGWLVYVLAGAWALAVWALFGGAIARIAALYLTHGETIGPIAALQAAARKWLSTAGAPTCALLGLLILALPLVVVGLLVRVDFLAMLLGLLWIIILIGGVAIAIVAIGLALGWPLMWATVAVERTDAFDGISRTYAYVYQRPLHAVFYLLVAGVLGLLGQTVVDVFVDGTLNATEWAVSAGSGDVRYRELLSPAVPSDAQQRGTMESAGSGAIRFWTTGVLWLGAVYPMAYLWPAATGIYLLLRRNVDSTELGEIVFDEESPSRGLPPLTPDPATGIPRVADAPPQPTGGDAAPPTAV